LYIKAKPKTEWCLQFLCNEKQNCALLLLKNINKENNKHIIIALKIIIKFMYHLFLLHISVS